MTLIKREDAIEAVEGLTKYMEKLVEGAEKFPEAHTKNYKHDMEQQIVGVAHASQVILELPSADAEWIPCSERLPEDKCDVLIQFGWNMAVGCIDGGDWRINSGDAWCTEVAEDDGKPIAWMPLPKPYREDGEL